MFWESIGVKELDPNALIGQQAQELQQFRRQGGYVVVQNTEAFETQDKPKPIRRFIWSVAVKVAANYVLKTLEP